MVKKTLVEEDINAGIEILKTFRKKKFPVVAMFWRYQPSGHEWLLVIATTVVDKKGPHFAYDCVLKYIKDSQITRITLNDISVISPNSFIVESVKKIGGGRGLKRSSTKIDYTWALSSEDNSDILVYNLAS